MTAFNCICLNICSVLFHIFIRNKCLGKRSQISLEGIQDKFSTNSDRLQQQIITRAVSQCYKIFWLFNPEYLVNFVHVPISLLMAAWMEEKVCTPSSVQLGDISPRNAAGSLIPPPANTALDLRGENCAQSFQMFGAFYNAPLELEICS